MKHIGFIMDGNRTWAREQGLSQFEGHKNGYQNIERIIDGCLEKGLEYVSFWALSDDNIRERSALEVKYLFDLLTERMSELVDSAMDRNIRLRFIGDRSLLRRDCVEALEHGERVTAENTGMLAVFAIGYGGQEEVVRAVRSLATAGRDMTRVTRDELLSVMDSGQFPPPDMIVRTGGHIRHSGYFLFQSPYAEYFFSEKNWPAFDRDELDAVFASYSERKRKFGK